MRLFKHALLAACAAAALPASPALAQEAGQTSAVYNLSCDRACLLGVLGQYMDALRARSPSIVPIADIYKFTENNVPLPLGKGLWRTVDKVDEVGLEVADTQTQNAAWFGSVMENGEPVLFAVRIRVRDGKIDEIESVAHRKGTLPAPFGDTRELVHFPEFNEVLPPEQRRSRERMRAIADGYFDTVEMNDGQLFTSFSEDCARLENAMKTAAVDRNQTKPSEFGEGCEGQLRLGAFAINKRIRERLYPIIDEERGVVVASAFFDHPNEWDHFFLTNGRRMDTWLKWANSISLLEAFRIKDAKIQKIEAVFTYVPHSMHNPWVGPASTPPAPVTSPQQCNSNCLSGLATQLMAAYPKRGQWRTLPWAENVGYEENSVGLQVGEGIWGSTTDIDTKPLLIADETLGRALWIGRIDEQKQPAWAAVTVSADGNNIGRVEVLVRRKEYLGPYAAPGKAPEFSTLPAKGRTPRNAMLSAVDDYYETLAAANGTTPASLAEQCQWTVNGQAVSGCSDPFIGRLREGLEQVRDRKVIAVDEARGLVAISAYEDYPAHIQQFSDSKGNVYSDVAPFPRTLQTVDLFRVESGKITGVDGFTSELGYGMKPR